MTVFINLLYKQIFNYEYKMNDKNLTDSYVGARRCRNIPNNIFVLNAIINTVKLDGVALLIADPSPLKLHQ